MTKKNNQITNIANFQTSSLNFKTLTSRISWVYISLFNRSMNLCNYNFQVAVYNEKYVVEIFFNSYNIKSYHDHDDLLFCLFECDLGEGNEVAVR